MNVILGPSLVYGIGIDDITSSVSEHLHDTRPIVCQTYPMIPSLVPKRIGRVQVECDCDYRSLPPELLIVRVFRSIRSVRFGPP